MKKTLWIIIALIIVILCAFCVQRCTHYGTSISEVTPTPPLATSTPASTPDDDVTEVTLYFIDENAEYLVPEKRSVKAKNINELALTTLNELIKGSKNNHGASIDPETKINSVKVENGICYIDFKSDFEIKNTGGSTKETFFIYSIANTLTEFDGIDEIKLLADGESVSEFGHFILDEALIRDDTKIKK